MNRGDIYWVDLAPSSGSEQTGRRPAVILSNDSFNRVAAWQSLVVIPIYTSTAQSRRGPTVVGIPAGIGGLSKASAAICHQITTVDRSKLGKKIGGLPLGILREVEAGLSAAVDLD